MSPEIQFKALLNRGLGSRLAILYSDSGTHWDFTLTILNICFIVKGSKKPGFLLLVSNSDSQLKAQQVYHNCFKSPVNLIFGLTWHLEVDMESNPWRMSRMFFHQRSPIFLCSIFFSSLELKWIFENFFHLAENNRQQNPDFLERWAAKKSFFSPTL